MLLINALVDPEAAEDLDVRVALRNQLYQAGLSRVLEKLAPLDSELLHSKMDEFRELEEHDAALIYGDMVLNDILDPPEILDNILSSVTGTECYDILRNILQHIMFIHGDLDTMIRCYRCIESAVSQIVRQQNELDPSMYGVTVDALISKFAQESQLGQQQMDEDHACDDTAADQAAADDHVDPVTSKCVLLDTV